MAVARSASRHEADPPFQSSWHSVVTTSTGSRDVSSILTNASALTALQSLMATQKALAQTQNQISTGLKIGSAADNAAYWSIATSMNSDNGALGAVSSALSESGAMLDTFTAALNQTITVVNAIKNDLVEAQQPGADLSKIQTDIAAQQAELKSIGASANFNGQDWLGSATPGTVSLVASYDPSNGVGMLTIDTTKTQLFDSPTAPTAGILGTSGAASGASVLQMDVTTSGLTVTDFSNMLTDVNTALTNIETAAATVGATRANVSTQQTFVSALQTALTNGVSSLVDADMNQASTRLQALQTQQQLGVQSLSIANQNAQLILKLFGG